LAADEGNAPCLRVLLKSGANHEAKDARGHTALHIAATCDTDSVLTLLKAGANPNATDANGRTPLHCSVSRGIGIISCHSFPSGNKITFLQTTIGSFLSESDMNRKNLFTSVKEIDDYQDVEIYIGSRAAECVRLLVENGAEIDAQDNFGYTPLHLAAVNESSQCASILLSHGADVTSK